MRKSLYSSIESLNELIKLCFVTVPGIESDDNEEIPGKRRRGESVRISAQIARTRTDSILSEATLPRGRQAGQLAGRKPVPKGPHRGRGLRAK